MSSLPGFPLAAGTPRVRLAHLPTPLVRPARLAEQLGLDLWVKRDDTTGGAEAGNKLRKLELLLADALRRKADVVVTCGGLQSNHARATALACASLGLQSVLLLRTADPSAPLPRAGNVVLDRLAGAEVRLITPEQYRERDRLLAEVASELRASGLEPYVVPEGGSNGLGALGYVLAMAEVRRQLELGLAGGRRFDLVVHACGSGGTAAGTVLGARAFDVADRVLAVAVCDDAPTFEARIGAIVAEARTLAPSLPEVTVGRGAELEVDQGSRGPAYAVATPEQLARITLVARLSGLVLDPVYTGKAMSALFERAAELRGKRVLFVHTGGLPGLLAQGDALAL